MAVRLATWLAAVLLALGAPAAALGQGAGDDQYIDPFGGGQSEEAPEEQPAPEPAAPEAEEPAPAPTAATAQETPEPQQQLPYTGADEGLVALAGAMLLAGGVALRLTSGRARRR